MAKGYWIASLDITDQAKYDAYRAINGEAFRKYGGRFSSAAAPSRRSMARCAPGTS